MPHRPTPRPLRWLTRVTTGVTSAGLLLLGAPVVVGLTGPSAGSETVSYTHLTLPTTERV